MYRSPARLLESRERTLEERLASVRGLLHAYADEERRLSWAPDQRELAAVRAAMSALVEEEASVLRELVAVREELVARGHRKVIVPSSASDGVTVWALLVLGALFAAWIVAALGRSTAF